MKTPECFLYLHLHLHLLHHSPLFHHFFLGFLISFRHSSQRLEFNGSSLEIKQRGLSTKDGSKKDGNTNEVGIRSAYTPHLWSCGNMLELLLLIFQGKKANFDERKHSWHPANLKVEVEIYRLTHCQDH
ncbi:uncharacterized protein [Nicotiana tomentosiformis]|uniref:uncharacterized protein isoform X4 n=1 Tax=Nicotiana tomentosiformis TaxID=4098 RepID=UPI001444ABAA|nr:uncharacterized protein LOC108945506 isoform X3 [Nicotiana tomentosiformis]